MKILREDLCQGTAFMDEVLTDTESLKGSKTIVGDGNIFHKQMKRHNLKNFCDFQE